MTASSNYNLQSAGTKEISKPDISNRFNPLNHEYALHHTYGGPGCALCGKPLEDHQDITVRREPAR